MSKQSLHQQVIAQLQADLELAQRALRSAHESATHEENVAENKYDTLGLEAAYLALGQARRVEQIAAALHAWQQLSPVELAPDAAIRLGALVLLEEAGGRRQQVLLGPDAAGLRLAHADGEITLVTAQAPLGRQLLGLECGEQLQVGAHHWTILRVS